MELCIRPIDVWLFRDGRPFTAGEDHDAVTIFPPAPFTLQGAVRTKVLVDNGVDLAVFARQRQPNLGVGFGDNFGRLQLLGPLIMRRKENDKWERLMPMPADVVSAGGRLVLLQPGNALPFKTNLPEGLCLLWTKELAVELKGWLPESEWSLYLQGKAPGCVLYDEELFTFEPRLGIAIERGTKTVQPQMLYRVAFVRLKSGVALWAKVDGVKLKERGFLWFGGEARGAVYNEMEEQLPDLASFQPTIDKRFKVVLLTPAWFSGGWEPRNRDWQAFFGFTVRLVAVAIPRPQKFGGFDVALGRPKPIRNFVPSGAVYFFEAESAPSFKKDFAFTETPEDVRRENDDQNAWTHIGLGRALIGVW